MSKRSICAVCQGTDAPIPIKVDEVNEKICKSCFETIQFPRVENHGYDYALKHGHKWVQIGDPAAIDRIDTLYARNLVIARARKIPVDIPDPTHLGKVHDLLPSPNNNGGRYGIVRKSYSEGIIIPNFFQTFPQAKTFLLDTCKKTPEAYIWVIKREELSSKIKSSNDQIEHLQKVLKASIALSENTTQTVNQ